MQKSLGKGSHGSVYLCLNMLDNQIMIMKVIRRSKQRPDASKSLVSGPKSNKTASPPNNRSSRNNELECLKETVHANVLSPIEIIDDPQSENVCHISPYVRAGSLEERLEESVKQRLP